MAKSTVRIVARLPTKVILRATVTLVVKNWPVVICAS
jgi:hypothetical protein